MKVSNLLLGLAIAVGVFGLLAQPAILFGTVPTLLVAAGAFAIADELKEKL